MEMALFLRVVLILNLWPSINSSKTEASTETLSSPTTTYHALSVPISLLLNSPTIV